MGHAEIMDAEAYWRGYEIRIPFDKPVEIVGVVEALRETRAKVSDPWTPRLAVRQDDGVLVIVDAYQARLLAELVLAKPAVGDRIRIRYLGEEKKAAPGLNPVKRFKVDVRRDSSGPGDGTGNPSESLGEVAEEPENASGTGK